MVIMCSSLHWHHVDHLTALVEGTNRGTNTSPAPNPGEQEEEFIIPNIGPQTRITPVETQEETLLFGMYSQSCWKHNMSICHTYR